jgi:hypothetical protein
MRGPSSDPSVHAIEAIGIVESEDPEHGNFDTHAKAGATVKAARLDIPASLPGVSSIPEQQGIGAGSKLETVF